MTIAVLIAVPVVAAIADTLIISNTLIVNQNAIRSPGEAGTAFVTLQPTNGTPTNDTNDCNANGSNPLTATLSSNNPDVTFPGGNTATLTGCGIGGVPVPYEVSSNAQQGTAVISATVSGGVPSTPTAPRLYNTSDTLTVTIDTSPKVSQVEPQEGANNVAVNTTVKATFSEAMQATTINNNTFTLVGPNGPVQAGPIAYDSTTKTATLTPSAPLDYDTE